MPRLTRALAALAAAGGLALATAGAAHAEPVRADPVKGCPVEDEHGNVTYVAPGTVVGIWQCGSDGEWHFGWAVTPRVLPDAYTVTASSPTTARVAGATRGAPGVDITTVGGTVDTVPVEFWHELWNWLKAHVFGGGGSTTGGGGCAPHVVLEASIDAKTGLITWKAVLSLKCTI
jgi:hypothetical protein